MSMVDNKLIEELSTKPTIGDVLGKLICELAIIADDIEELPFTGVSSLTNEELMAYQKIDFSSQKLRDFSKLLNHLTKSNVVCDLAVPNGVMEELQLEYTAELLESNIG